MNRFLESRRTVPARDGTLYTLPDAAHAALLDALQDAALAMLDRGEWALPLGALRARCLAAVPKLDARETDNAHALRVFQHHVPCRVESLHDDGAVFAFFHKSLAEYLAARALFAAPAAALAACSSGCFSKREPGVLSAFNDLALTHPRRRAVAALGPLYAAVTTAASSPSAAAVASNALALLCASGQPLDGVDLSGVRAAECNLQGADFSRALLRGAAITRSNCRNARFDCADVSGLALEGNAYSIPLLPLEGHTNSVNSVAYSSN